MLKLKKIAVTGQMGVGKTTVCQCFENHNSFIVSTDKIVEQLLISDKECIRKVKTLLGENVVVDGQIDKKKVARLVFSNKKLLFDLEKILHPLVYSAIHSLYLKCLELNNNQFFVVEIPLLFEIGWEKFFDVTIYVTCEKTSAFQRARHAGFSFSDFEARLSRFISQEEAMEKADIVIFNEGTKKQLEEKVEFIINNLRKTS